MFRIGIDSGGTFTDFVLLDGPAVSVAKVPSSRQEPEMAVERGLRELAAQHDLELEGLLAETEYLIYGTTVATNALLQHRGAKTALLCTGGFRDSFEIRQGYKEERYNFELAPPPLLVPGERRIPIEERIDKHGGVHTDLDEDDAREKIRALAGQGIESVAISLLFSYLNPEHENRLAEILADELPEAFRSVSSSIMPRIREYDRTSTTILNAYLAPALLDHLDRVQRSLERRGYAGPFRILQANAGCAAAAELRRVPLNALNSGPAAAPVAAGAAGKPLGHDNLVSIDMGGTSFDVCLVVDGAPEIVTTSDVCRYRVGLPMVNVHTIGAGGGSIASVVDGLLRVGPQSAEAMPGPACYGNGGVEPTVTDANLVLGFLNPDGLLGGTMPLDRRAAERAIMERVGKPLGLSLEAAAHGIYEVINHTMTSGTSEITIERGYDPRDFAVVTGGGAGALHAAAITRELGAETVLVPRLASVYCAYGAVVGDMRHDETSSYGVPTPMADLDIDRLAKLLDSMEQRGMEAVGEDAGSATSPVISRWLEMRYRGQIHECNVPLDTPIEELAAGPAAVAAVEDAFHGRHQALYAYADRGGAPVELVNVGVSVRRGLGESVGDSVTRRRGGGDPSAARTGSRQAYLDPAGGFLDTPVYDGALLSPGDTFAGPALIEEATTTILVPVEAQVSVAPHDVYVIELQ